jgi:hypothetical protein
VFRFRERGYLTVALSLAAVPPPGRGRSVCSLTVNRRRVVFDVPAVARCRSVKCRLRLAYRALTVVVRTRSLLLT